MKLQSYQQSAKALGSTVTIILRAHDQDIAEKLFERLWQDIALFQQQFSRFESSSELSIFNKNAGSKTIISNELEDILKKVQYFAQITDGLFNPFILPELHRIGYHKSITSTEKGKINYSDRRITSITGLTIGKGWGKIPSNTAIDLGGIGKGYLADKLGESLDKKQINNYCISVGGDIIAEGTGLENKQWSIPVVSIRDSSSDVAIIKPSMKKFAVATSGSYRTRPDGTKQHHLINPISGKKFTTNKICTVLSKHTTSADVIASCILLGGKKLATKMTRESIIIGALIQSLDKNNRVSTERVGQMFETIQKSGHTKSADQIYA